MFWDNTIEPKSLSRIWGDIHTKYFRVRNTETLEDYIIVDIKAWTQGLPYSLSAMKCDESIFTVYQLDSWSRTYALLSTREEVEFLKNITTERQVAFKVKYSYRRNY